MKLICPKCGNIRNLKSGTLSYIICGLLIGVGCAILDFNWIILFIVGIPIIILLSIFNVLFLNRCIHCEENNLVDLDSKEGIEIYNKFHNKD